MPSFLLVVTLPPELADAGAGLLHLAGAGGVETRAHGELGPPGAPPLPEGTVELRGHFERRAEAEEARALLEARLGSAGRLDEIPEEAWAESWKRHFRPLRLGRILVLPPWSTEEPAPGERRLVLEPGLAFGTGSHETTSLCLRALDEALAARPGASVLDVGTGSGILAIAARLLGAGRLIATDDDAVAVRVARENAARNGVALDAREAPLEEVSGGFDLVVANILANTLVALAPGLAPKVAPGGLLFLSGILGGQEDEVARAFGPPLRERPRWRDGDWMLLTFERPIA